MHFLVFQHLAVEHPGIFRDFLRADGHTWDTVALDEGDPLPRAFDAWDGLFVMGGPMDVWEETRLPWLAAEKRAIRRWVVEERRPFLGICLGHQLLAEAVGGAVGPMAVPEVGICAARLTPAGEVDPLLGATGSPFTCLQWHGAEVTSLPVDARVLAVNEAGVVEAFSFGPCAWGLQYHVEVTSDTVPEWGAVPAYADALRQVMGEGGQARFEADTARQLPGLNAAARTLYGAFLRAVTAAKAGRTAALAGAL